MLCIFRALIILSLLVSTSFAAVNQVEEVDGSPSMFPWKVKFDNGSLTNNGDGTMTHSIAGGGAATFLRLDTSNGPLTGNLSLADTYNYFVGSATEPSAFAFKYYTGGYGLYFNAGTGSYEFTTGDESSITQINVNTGTITTPGNISARADIDDTSILGRAKIGYDGLNSDLACFSHYDQMGWNTWALAQEADGDTYLSGQTIRMRLTDGTVYAGLYNSGGIDPRFYIMGAALCLGGTAGSERVFFRQSGTDPTLLDIDTPYSNLRIDLHGGMTIEDNVGIGTTDLDGTPAIGRLTVKGTTNDGSTNIFVGRDSDEANVMELDTNGQFKLYNSAGSTYTSLFTYTDDDFYINPSDPTNYVHIVCDNGNIGSAAGIDGVTSFSVINNMTGTSAIAQFGCLNDSSHTSIFATTSSTYTGLSDTVIVGNYNCANGLKIYGSLAGAGDVDIFNGAATQAMHISGGNVAIGTTDLDGTPAIGRLVVKGSTNDGSTNIFVGRDSDEANVIDIDTNGQIDAAPDTDTSHQFGRAHIGYMGFADFAGFSHVDSDSTTGYALLQNAGGQTYLNGNATANEGIHIRLGNRDAAGGTGEEVRYCDDGVNHVFAHTGYDDTQVTNLISRNKDGGSYNTAWYNYIPADSTDLRWYNGSDLLTLTTAGIIKTTNAIYLTQADGNEYIDSLADDYTDVGATTGIRLNSPLTRVTGDLYVGNDADVDPAIVFDGDTTDGQITYDEDNDIFTTTSALTAGLVTANAGISAKNGATSAGFLDIYEDSDDGSNYTRFIVQAQAGDVTYTLPNAVGGAGSVLTDAAGNGTLSWAVPAGLGDITAVGDVADGAAFNGTQGTTLTFFNAGGNATVIYDGTDIAFSKPIDVASNITSEPKHLRFNILDPATAQGVDNEICIWPVTDAAITVTKITVTLDAAANEVAGDLKYADAFIGLANATVINPFDTTSGVLADDSIASGSVASGKCIYISFDSAPSATIKQMCVDVQYNY